MGSNDAFVPSWDIVCPSCDYPLRGLPEQRCPECGTRFELEDVIRPWTRTREPIHRPSDRPVADFGIRCVGCGADLAGAAESVCIGCGISFNLDSFIPRGSWVTVKPEDYPFLTWADLEILLTESNIPAVPIRRTGIASNLLGAISAGAAWMLPREFVLDFLAAIVGARRRLSTSRDQAAAAERPCPECSAANPAHFELCWSCGGPLDAIKG